MPNCTRCGTRVLEEHRFCSGCGSQLGHLDSSGPLQHQSDRPDRAPQNYPFIEIHEAFQRMLRFPPVPMELPGYRYYLQGKQNAYAILARVSPDRFTFKFQHFGPQAGHPIYYEDKCREYIQRLVATVGANQPALLNRAKAVTQDLERRIWALGSAFATLPINAEPDGALRQAWSDLQESLRRALTFIERDVMPR